jgi:hypothetical protein
MFLFEERLETFFRRSEGLGMNLRPYHASGHLQIRDFIGFSQANAQGRTPHRKVPSGPGRYWRSTSGSVTLSQ